MIRTLEGHAGRVNAVALTADGRRAVSASDDRTLKVWDIESGKMIASFTGESYMLSCAFSPDGQTIVAGEASGRVHFLRLEGLPCGQGCQTAILEKHRCADVSRKPASGLSTAFSGRYLYMS